MFRSLCIAFFVLFTTVAIASAKDASPKEKATEKPKTKMSAATFSGFKLRSIGPALMSGRISDVAIDQVKPNVWYVAAGSGNLWKTNNAGTTWTTIFEKQASYSIGCVTIDPSNRHTIWVGTGEAVGGRHVGYGDGVYKSTDGGKSFKNVGLKKSEHIAKILVDPRNSNVVYVACQGPLWSSGGERGLYKTTDGGKTWNQILAKGPFTGVTDIALDPRSPQTIYAVTHQRHRTVWALINGGPESDIYKSTDGGKNWRALKTGLPGGDKGKIGIAISPQKPDVIYATIELPEHQGGFWRSADRGETWTKMNDLISGGTGPHYYQELFADPHRFDVVYQVNVRMGRTEDGGKTWTTVERPAKHVDNHAVGFHPSDPDFLLIGCDGGLYRSYDRGKTFAFCANLPLTQFYKLSLDNDYPFYNVVGGTQDNNTQYGPTRTNNVSGIRNSDWKTIIGGDGHDNAIDPKDSNIVYCESQEGFLRRYDRRTGESVDIRPQPEKGEVELRHNWDSPIHISPHSHKRIYFGSKKLHRSDDRGDSWTTISGDLSRNLDRLTLKAMNRVWSVDAVYDLYAMSQYGNITSISESPLKEGLIYVGTDDGLIQVTEDGGKTWRKIDRVIDVPEFSFVNDIKADLHDVNTVYAVFDRHKTGDFKPYLMKSTDRGHTWKSIAGDLPERHIVWRFVQDHVKPNLCFVGTEFGLFFSLNGGTNWIKFTGGVPTIAFRDIEIQRRENDLVGATFGRGFFVLDDYSPLRSISEELLTKEEFVLFAPRKSLLYIPARPLGRGTGSQGDAFFAAKNPPQGAVFTYYLRDASKTEKAKRHEQEATTQKAGGDNVIPKFDTLRKEEREEKPTIILTIRRPDGKVVNRIEVAPTAGLHRVAWNLHYASATGGEGPMVTPGKYSVSAARRVADVTTPLGKPQTFEVVALGGATLPIQDRKEVLAFQMQAGELLRVIDGADGKMQETLNRLTAIKKAVRKARNAKPDLYNEARQLELKLLDIRVLMRGDTTRTSRSKPAKISIRSRVSNAYSRSLFTTHGPTKTHRRDYEIGREEYAQVAGKLRQLIDVDFAKLQNKLDKAGVAWTSGRPIPNLKKPAK